MESRDLNNLRTGTGKLENSASIDTMVKLLSTQTKDYVAIIRGEEGSDVQYKNFQVINQDVATMLNAEHMAVCRYQTYDRLLLDIITIMRALRETQAYEDFKCTITVYYDGQLNDVSGSLI